MPLGYPLTFPYQNNRISQFLGSIEARILVLNSVFIRFWGIDRDETRIRAGRGGAEV